MEKTEKRMLMCQLTEEDRVRLSKDQTKHYQDSLALQQKIDRLKAEQKPHEKQIEKIFAVLIAGEEERNVECHWVYDFPGGTKYCHRGDTGEEVENRPISEFEKQQELRVA